MKDSGKGPLKARSLGSEGPQGFGFRDTSFNRAAVEHHKFSYHNKEIVLIPTYS